MAKGLRSKVKRRNRTALREQVMAPKALKKQTEVSKSLHEAIAEKSSLFALKNRLAAPKTAATKQNPTEVATVEVTVAEMDVEEDSKAKVAKSKKTTKR